MKKIFALSLILFCFSTKIESCSILYYIDQNTGTIYAANHEDYWYDVKPYIQIKPKSTNKKARLWYGWKNFAQGGINESGLFFDGAATPKQQTPNGYQNPSGRNIGDEILAQCSTVQEAVDFLEKEKIALSDGHILFGDRQKDALIIEWVEGKRKIIPITGDWLAVTNYLLSDTLAGNYPCSRYSSIENKLQKISATQNPIDLKTVGNTLAGAAQPPFKNNTGKIGGTLYSSFINITNLEFFLVPKLNNSKVIHLDLNEEFKRKRSRKIRIK